MMFEHLICLHFIINKTKLYQFFFPSQCIAKLKNSVSELCCFIHFIRRPCYEMLYFLWNNDDLALSFASDHETTGH